MKRFLFFLLSSFFFSVISATMFFPSPAGAASQPKYVISIPPSDEKLLLDRQEALKIESDRLVALQKDVDQKIAKYQDLLARVQEALKELNSLSSQATARLVKVYETMPAENTAQTISALDEATAVKIILAMKPRKAAAVMAAMSVKKAASISSRILSIGKKVPIR